MVRVCGRIRVGENREKKKRGEVRRERGRMVSCGRSGVWDFVFDKVWVWRIKFFRFGF